MLGRTPDFINAAVATISAHAGFSEAGNMQITLKMQSNIISM